MIVARSLLAPAVILVLCTVARAGPASACTVLPPMIGEPLESVAVVPAAEEHAAVRSYLNDVAHFWDAAPVIVLGQVINVGYPDSAGEEMWEEKTGAYPARRVLLNVTRNVRGTTDSQIVFYDGWAAGGCDTRPHLIVDDEVLAILGKVEGRYLALEFVLGLQNDGYMEMQAGESIFAGDRLQMALEIIEARATALQPVDSDLTPP